MLKGCQKRVIWVRNPESKWFDEAYFILSDEQGANKKSPNEGELIREANKIIASSPFSGYYGFSNTSKKKCRKSNIFRCLGWIATGVILTLLCAVICKILV